MIYISSYKVCIVCELKKHTIQINRKRTESAQIGQTKTFRTKPRGDAGQKFMVCCTHIANRKNKWQKKTNSTKKKLNKWCSMSSERWGTSAVHEVCIVSMLRAQDHIANLVFMSRHEKHAQAKQTLQT